MRQKISEVLRKTLKVDKVSANLTRYYQNTA
jgi:hypothetical protein